MIPPSSALYLFWELVQADLVLIVGNNGQSLFILRQLDRSALAAFLGVAATT